MGLTPETTLVILWSLFTGQNLAAIESHVISAMKKLHRQNQSKTELKLSFEIHQYSFARVMDLFSIYPLKTIG